MSSKCSLQCKFIDHGMKEIHGVCVNQTCQSMRPYCNDCLKAFHSQHFQDLVDLQDIEQWAKDSQEAYERMKFLVDELYQFAQSLMSFFKKINYSQSTDFSCMSIDKLNNEINQLLYIKTLQPTIIELENVVEAFSPIKLSLKEIVSQNQNQIKIVPVQPILRPSSADRKDRPVLRRTIQSYHPSATIKQTQTQVLFKFSQKYKSDEITILQSGISAISNKEKGYGFVACEQKIPKEGVTKFAFKISTLGNGVHLGVCHRDLVQDIKFKPDIWKDINHGVYCLQNQGYVYSHIEKKNNDARTIFKFINNEIIIVEVNMVLKYITWIKKSSSLSYQIKIDTNIDLYPCVYLWDNASVDLLHHIV